MIKFNHVHKRYPGGYQALKNVFIVPTLHVGTHHSPLYGVVLTGQSIAMQSVTGDVPTQSVGTIATEFSNDHL